MATDIVYSIPNKVAPYLVSPNRIIPKKYLGGRAQMPTQREAMRNHLWNSLGLKFNEVAMLAVIW